MDILENLEIHLNRKHQPRRGILLDTNHRRHNLVHMVRSCHCIQPGNHHRNRHNRRGLNTVALRTCPKRLPDNRVRPNAHPDNHILWIELVFLLRRIVLPVRLRWCSLKTSTILPMYRLSWIVRCRLARPRISLSVAQVYIISF